MNGYKQTQREFTDAETGIKYSLFMHQDTHDYKLIITEKNDTLANGAEVNGFYICTHTDVQIKVNNSKIINLPLGTFYNIKENEKVTHRKFIGFKKFTKI